MNGQKIFLDTDVIIDLLTEREPHFTGTVKLFLHIQNKKALAFTSPVVFANLSNLLRKRIGKDDTVNLLRKLNTMVKILTVNQKVIEMALASDFTDFEDAIQFIINYINANGTNLFEIWPVPIRAFYKFQLIH